MMFVCLHMEVRESQGSKNSRSGQSFFVRRHRCMGNVVGRKRVYVVRISANELFKKWFASSTNGPVRDVEVLGPIYERFTAVVRLKQQVQPAG